MLQLVNVIGATIERAAEDPYVSMRPCQRDRVRSNRDVGGAAAGWVGDKPAPIPVENASGSVDHPRNALGRNRDSHSRARLLHPGRALQLVDVIAASPFVAAENPRVAELRPEGIGTHANPRGAGAAGGRFKSGPVPVEDL